ncbi:hypothetical protein LAZ67_1002617 [Cordylochernes scorpioides]|uniref:Uncharacterized protein n=1 Tax=Cordylochernes scorpioides TaxID=51811 RepID=A0ABY6K0Z3_9ARAC|nr:hypothetical protein LAZ67_1002617 [Cordylochernes scorpioides]
MPQDLVNHRIWWRGPIWLQENNARYIPSSPTQVNLNIIQEEVGEGQVLDQTTLIQNSETMLNLEFIERYSTMTKLIRITAWCWRFYYNCRLFDPIRQKVPLTTRELTKAIQVLVKSIQQVELCTEIKLLKSNKQLPLSNKLTSLNPFLDTQGLLRVGGRLKYSYLNENQKFPLLQPKSPRQESLIKNLLTENADIPEAIDENQEDSSILETTFVIEDEESNKDIGTPKIEISEVSVIDKSEGKYSKEPVVSVEALDKKELCHDDSAHLNVVEADLNRPKEATSGIINVYTEANESASKEKAVSVEIVDTSTKDYLQSGEKAKLSRWKPIDSLCLEDVKESEDDDENYSSSAYIEWPEILKKEVLIPEALEKAVNLEDFEKAAESRQLSKEHLEQCRATGVPWHTGVPRRILENFDQISIRQAEEFLHIKTELRTISNEVQDIKTEQQNTKPERQTMNKDLKAIKEHQQNITPELEKISKDLKVIKVEQQNTKPELQAISIELKDIKVEQQKINTEVQEMSIELNTIKVEQQNTKPDLQVISRNLKDIKVWQKKINPEVQAMSIELNTIKVEKQNTKPEIEAISKDLKDIKVGQQKINPEIQAMSIEMNTIKVEQQNTKPEIQAISKDIRDMKIEQEKIKPEVQTISKELKDIKLKKNIAMPELKTIKLCLFEIKKRVYKPIMQKDVGLNLTFGTPNWLPGAQIYEIDNLILEYFYGQSEGRNFNMAELATWYNYDHFLRCQIGVERNTIDEVDYKMNWCVNSDTEEVIINIAFLQEDLTFDQKNARKDTASLNLEAKTDDPELLKRVIPGDEAWIYSFDSETPNRHLSGASKCAETKESEEGSQQSQGHVDGVLRLPGHRSS